jgi:hypothetical protein
MNRDSEREKMKNLFYLATALMALFFLGCASNVSNPGDVLGEDGSSAQSQKVVTFYVTGKGLEPETALTKGEAVIMAERAAVADGYRQLVEKLRGVYVDAYMKSGSGTVNRDLIQVRTQSWLRGAEVMELSHQEYGITTAKMRIRINFTKKGMVWWPVGLGNSLKTSKPSFFSRMFS